MVPFGTTTFVAATVAATLAGGAAGAAIHATMTARVAVTCPATASTSRDQDLDAALRRFMSPPAPPTAGNPRY